MTRGKNFVPDQGWLPKSDLILNLLNSNGVGKTPHFSSLVLFGIAIKYLKTKVKDSNHLAIRVVTISHF